MVFGVNVSLKSSKVLPTLHSQDETNTCHQAQSPTTQPPANQRQQQTRAKPTAARIRRSAYVSESLQEETFVDESTNNSSGEDDHEDDSPETRALDFQITRELVVH